MSTNNESVTFPKGVPVNLIFPADGLNLNLNIKLTVTVDRDVTGLLQQILDQQKELKAMATALDDKIAALQAAVAKETDVEKSASSADSGIPRTARRRDSEGAGGGSNITATAGDY